MSAHRPRRSKRKPTPRRRPYRPSRDRPSGRPLGLPSQPSRFRLDRLSVRDAIGLNFGLMILGALICAGLVMGGDDLITRWGYLTGSETARGTVTAVVGGEPEVAFTTADGTVVSTLARGTYSHGGPVEVEVRYLAGEPQEAALADGMWVPPLLYCLPTALALIVMGVHHPDGPRVILYQARRRAHEWYRSRGYRGRASITTPAAVRLAAGTILVMGSVTALTVALVRVAVGTWEGADHEFLPTAAGALLFLPGLFLLFQGWWRYLEEAPRGRPPVPPRVLPEGLFLGAGALLFGLALAAGSVFIVVAGIQSAHVEHPVHGTATVLSAGCGGINTGQGCANRLVAEYEADGLRYVSVVWDRGQGVSAGGRLPLVWEADDPADVRPNEEG